MSNSLIFFVQRDFEKKAPECIQRTTSHRTNDSGPLKYTKTPQIETAFKLLSYFYVAGSNIFYICAAVNVHIYGWDNIPCRSNQTESGYSGMCYGSLDNGVSGRLLAVQKLKNQVSASLYS